MSEPVARILQAKARHDLNVAKILLGVDSSEVGDVAFGYHLQQAVEKASKALLSKMGRRYPFIHEIDKLFLALKNAGVAIPSQFLLLENLTPFAVNLRYETVDSGAFDRKLYMVPTEGFVDFVGLLIDPSTK